jgi:hypothetical protein
MATANNKPDGTSSTTGDQIIYTFNQVMDASTIYSGWSGTSGGPTSLTNGASFSRTQGNSTQLTITNVSLGSVDLGDHDVATTRYVNSAGNTYTENASIQLVTSGGRSVVTVTLTSNNASISTMSPSGATTWAWLTSATAKRTGGTAITSTTVTQGSAKQNF